MNKIALLLFLIAALSGCDNNHEFTLADIHLMEPGNIAVIKTKVKEAHIICAEVGNCGFANDTIISTYYDEKGRLVKAFDRSYGIVNESMYTDNTNWKTKQVIQQNGTRTYTFVYRIDPVARVLTQLIMEGNDTVGAIPHKFNEQGWVYEYGPDMADLVHFLEYNDEGLVTREIAQYPDNSTYTEKFGESELHATYKTESQFFYNQDQLDSSIIHYYDVNGHKHSEPMVFKYRYDGLVEYMQGQRKFIFSYVK